jgi:hypothetical protein
MMVGPLSRLIRGWRLFYLGQCSMKCNESCVASKSVLCKEKRKEINFMFEKLFVR